MTKQELKLFYQINKYNLKKNKKNKKISYQTEHYIDLHKKVYNFIEQIKDSLIKQIFEYRYLKSMKWQEVANMIGSGYTQDCVRKIATRYLERINR